MKRWDSLFLLVMKHFEKHRGNNFLEHAQFVGNRYGTPRDYVEKLLNEGKNVLIEIEVDGARQLLKMLIVKKFFPFI